jgi:aspartate aminotransferase
MRHAIESQPHEAPSVSARIRTLEPSATLEVDARARRLRESGRAVIALGTGEPDFPTPVHIQRAAADAVTNPANHAYGPAAGLPALRAEIARQASRRWGDEIGASSVVVCNGAKHAAYAAMQTLLDPGDEVLHQVPLWPTFAEVVRLAGGRPVGIPVAPRDQSWDLDRLCAAITPKTKAILVVSPSNPTGAVWEDAALREIADLAARHGLWLITDQIYDRLAYAHEWAPSLPVAAPHCRERCIVLNGVSKSYAMTGWRVGWILAPPHIAAALTKLQGQMTSNVCNVAQVAALAALEGPQDALVAMKAVFARRRDKLVEDLRRMPGVTVATPGGAFYAYPDLRGALTQLGLPDTATFAQRLLTDAGVAIVPGEAFGTPGFARLSFALGDEELGTAVRRLHDFIRGQPSEF